MTDTDPRETAAPDAATGAPETPTSRPAERAEADIAEMPTGPAETRAASAEELVPGLGDAVEAERLAEAEARLDALEAERDDLKDRLVRALAEAENIRKRGERDRKDAETYAGTKLARDLLSVHDNLDRALGAADGTLRESHGAFLEGVELTKRELLAAFAKHRIETVHPEPGERFDPNRHQAMFEAPVPGATPGTVIEVMQAGFTIAERLLRPALVGVAKAAPQPAEPAEPGDAADARPDMPES
ncbi:MAG: nucleotide exchange factor GrpE [Paracoccaceae bacterium]